MERSGNGLIEILFQQMCRLTEEDHELQRQENWCLGISLELSSAVYEWPVYHKCCYVTQLVRVLYNIIIIIIIHGQYIRNINRQLISEEDTFHWLSKGDLKAETESEIVTAQDQALNTKYYATKILHTETDSKCRLCQQHDETIDHITSVCPILAKEQYVKRQDKVSA